jgi:amidophosphoribosyltransferase
VKFPCFYGVDLANQDQLVAAKNSVEEIRRLIGATSLGFLSPAGLSRAVHVPNDNFCLACFTGEYPIDIPPHVKLSKFALEMPMAAPAATAQAPGRSAPTPSPTRGRGSFRCGQRRPAQLGALRWRCAFCCSAITATRCSPAPPR